MKYVTTEQMKPNDVRPISEIASIPTPIAP